MRFTFERDRILVHGGFRHDSVTEEKAGTKHLPAVRQHSRPRNEEFMVATGPEGGKREALGVAFTADRATRKLASGANLSPITNAGCDDWRKGLD